jgi:hypothetical protein
MPDHMTREEKYKFIFENDPDPDARIKNRFGWLDTALFSDIKTLVYGSKCVVDKDIDGSHGAGNVSIPILVCTGLELASRLYAGKDVSATDSVKGFIKKYFPDRSPIQSIPLILWEGIRNGTNHVFIPNIIKTTTYLVDFTFFVNHDLPEPSFVTKSNNTLKVYVNAIEFYHKLKEAIGRYKSDLEIDETLQCQFIDVWQQIEQPRDRSKDDNIPNEVKYLLRNLAKSDRLNLFSGS